MLDVNRKENFTSILRLKQSEHIIRRHLLHLCRIRVLLIIKQRKEKGGLQTKFFIAKLARFDLLGILFKKGHGYLLKLNKFPTNHPGSFRPYQKKLFNVQILGISRF